MEINKPSKKKSAFSSMVQDHPKLLHSSMLITFMHRFIQSCIKPTLIKGLGYAQHLDTSNKADKERKSIST